MEQNSSNEIQRDNDNVLNVSNSNNQNIQRNDNLIQHDHNQLLANMIENFYINQMNQNQEQGSHSNNDGNLNMNVIIPNQNVYEEIVDEEEEREREVEVEVEIEEVDELDESVEEYIGSYSDNSNDEYDDVLMRFIDHQRPDNNPHIDPYHVTYDILQTDQHAYLGDMNGDQTSKELYFIPGTIREDVPLFFCTHFVPAPLQEFPLSFYSVSYEELLPLISGIFIIGHDEGFGLTVDVNETSSSSNSTNVRVIGRQRVKIHHKNLRISPNNFAYYLAKIEFLPEFSRDPLSFFTSTAQTYDVKSLSSLFSLPQSALEQLNQKAVISNIHNHLSKKLKNYSDIKFPDDSYQMSFFLLNFIPLSINVKSFIIQLPSTIERLLYLDAIFSTTFDIRCSKCYLKLYKSNSFICMKRNSNSCVFVNPYGYVFELFPMTVEPTILALDTFSREYSWFPGYSWAISTCQSCRNHIGWIFHTDRLNISPRTFSTITTKSAVITFPSSIKDNPFINIIRNIDLNPKHDNICID